MAYSAALFDFDGTLSLIRTGWQRVMVPMMVDQLMDKTHGKECHEIEVLVKETVWRLTGKDTIYQMEALAGHIRGNGGIPLDPRAYKREYLRRLDAAIHSRIEGLEAGTFAPDSLLVPGARVFLEELSARGMRLYLASGTDHEDVIEEARLLHIDHFFEGRIFGARDDRSVSKALVVRGIIAQACTSPSQLIGFGDGYVEVEEVKNVGGTAIGVATREPECLEIDEWKRQRLTAVGADRIIVNFLDLHSLLPILANGQS